MQKLRILHVFRAPLGGLFRHVVDVARGQSERGHEVGIFCDSTTGGTRGDAALASLAPELALGVTRVPMRRLPHPLDAAAVAKLTWLYGRTRPHVLHGHGSKGGAFARLATHPALDRTTVRAYTPHGGSFNYRPGTLAHRLYMGVETLLARRTDVFLFESGYVKGRFDSFVGETKALSRIVHNGIEEAEFEPLERPPDPFDLVYIGELREAKGVDTLIDALATIRKENDLRLTLLAVGSGPSEAEFKARARASGVWDSIAFVPPQPIRTALSRGRVMVIPSKAESLPYVILEAAAAGQPLVSTNVGGIREIFGPYADELIPAGDPALLAAKILQAVREPEEARQRKAAALRQFVHAGFRIDRMVDGVMAGYADARIARGLGPTR
ncbi:MAG: glycosyl transferase group 1 [Enterovirga sp.]|nr:glycosyl transferase group 1 [Enterovirga sp.]